MKLIFVPKLLIGDFRFIGVMKSDMFGLILGLPFSYLVGVL